METLVNLAGASNGSIKQLEGIVHSLRKENKPDLQCSAAKALQNVAYRLDASLNQKIASTDYVLESLVKCLFNKRNSALQLQAASTLATLADSGNNSVKQIIMKEDGFLVSSGMCLSAESSAESVSSLQAIVGRLLLTVLIAIESDSIKLEITFTDGMLAGLVKCLSRLENYSLQEDVARIFRMLTTTEEDSIKKKVADEEGAVAGLAGCLFPRNTAFLQFQAASALANLADIDDGAVKQKIANQNRFLAGCVSYLRARNWLSPKLILQALASLVEREDDSIKLKIANHDGILEALMICLSRAELSWLHGSVILISTSLTDVLHATINQNNTARALAALVRCKAGTDRKRGMKERARAEGSMSDANGRKSRDGLKAGPVGTNGSLVKRRKAHNEDGGLGGKGKPKLKSTEDAGLDGSGKPKLEST